MSKFGYLMGTGSCFGKRNDRKDISKYKNHEGIPIVCEFLEQLDYRMSIYSEFDFKKLFLTNQTYDYAKMKRSEIFYSVSRLSRESIENCVSNALCGKTEIVPSPTGQSVDSKLRPQ